ncbi:hypothetical protein ACFPRL_17075 [Pseudoclavibacter helvolus]
MTVIRVSPRSMLLILTLLPCVRDLVLLVVCERRLWRDQNLA